MVNFMSGVRGKMPLFLVSFFAKSKIKLLFGLLGLLSLLGLVGLSYTKGRSDGRELERVAHLESANQNKDQVIEELRLNSQQQLELFQENLRTNVILSKDIQTQFDEIKSKLESVVNVPTVVNSDCRAEYDGTIGVFKSLAQGGTDSN